MALLKNKYEISVWENLNTEDEYGYTILTTQPVDWGNTTTGHYYYKNNNNWVQVTDEEWDDDTTYYTRFKKFKESKLAIIGSDTMTSECRALEPCLTSNINGTNTFTFKMFYTYIDTQTGKRVENSWIPLLMNEVYLKVHWKDKWYDFIIKNRVEDSSGKSVTFTCEDLFVNELSKTGFNLEFDTELENNQGTVFQLAERALVDTDWTLVKPQENVTYPTVDGKTFAPEIIKQYTEEPVYLCVRTNTSTSATDYVLLFYSQVTNEAKENLQMIYYDGTDYFPTDTNSLLVTRNKVQRIVQPTVSWSGRIITYSGYSISVPSVVSSDYRAERLVDSQKSLYDAKAQKYVSVYTDSQNNDKKTYGFLKTDYDSSLMVTNCATWDDSGVEGWEEPNGDLYWTLYPPFEKDTDVATYSSQGYLRVKNNQTVTNTGIEDHSTFLSDGLIAGQRYIVRFRSRIGNVNKPTSGWVSTNNHRQYYNENIVVELKKYLKKSAGTFVENAFTLETNKYVWHGDQCWHEVGFLCNKSTPRKNLDDVIINVKWLNKNYPGTNTKYTLWITDFEFFPVIRDKDNNIIYPGDFAAQSRAMVRYYYYYPDDNTKAKSEDEIDYVYTASELNDTRFKKILNEDNAKVRSISVKQSNRFNILQTLAETFQCWAKFGINHDPNTGKIIIDEITGLPQKYITFVNSIGEDRGYGFVYGIDLKTIQRTIQSKQLVTKTIVQPNSNEFGQNGFCTISRAIDNVPKTNFIINLDYYVANGMLDGGTLANDLYSKVDDNLGYYIRLKEINTEYDKSLETYTKLKLELNQQEGLLDVYTKLVKSTTEELNSVEVDMMKLAGVSSIDQATAYFQENFNDKTKALTNDRGQLSTKVQNYTKTRDTLEQAVNGEGGLKDRIEEIEELNKLYVKQIEDLDRAFNSKYSRYLQEGSWISEDYMDDDLYYLDGLNVAYTASRPQVQYSINVLRLTALEEFKNKIFDVGDIGFIEDKEFFGYEPDHITPIKEKIVVSQLASYFDSPERDTITIQNYKTQFEDLFQRITSTTQSLQFAQGEYAKTAGTLNSDMTIKADILQSSLKQNLKIVTDATNESVIQDSTGITIIDINNPNKQLKLTSGGLVFTNDGGITWTTGADAEGIRPNYLATGTINTDSITLGSLSAPTFRWSSEGISAYAWDTSAPELGVKTNQFVRFDQYGMYGIRGIQNFSADGQYKEVGSYIPAEVSDMSNWATLYVVAPGGSYEHADVVAPQWSPNTYYRLNDYPDFQSDPVIFYKKNITYQLLEDEPQSWDDVYIKDENGHYQQVAGEPSWSEDTYYEQIIGEGWIQLTEEPYDWGLNYTDYHEKVGNNYNLVPYELLTSETAPSDWESKYYNYYIIIDDEMADVDGVAPTWQENTYFKRNIPSYEANTYYQYTNGAYYKLLGDQPDDWYSAEGKYFEPVTDGIQAIKDNALFGFTWDGFFLKGDGDWISITSENGYEVFNPKWRFQEEATQAGQYYRSYANDKHPYSVDENGVFIPNGDLIPVISLGRFYDTNTDVANEQFAYGLRLRDRKGFVTLSTDNKGDLWSLRQLRAGNSMYNNYILITDEEEPANWSSNYVNYYTHNNITGDYEPVEGDEAPTWAANTYYYFDDEGSIAGLNGTILTLSDISNIAPILAKLEVVNSYEVQESNTITVKTARESTIKEWDYNYISAEQIAETDWSEVHELLYFISNNEFILNGNRPYNNERTYYTHIFMSLEKFQAVNDIESTDNDTLPVGTYYVYADNVDLSEYAVRIWAGADETYSNSRFIVFKNGYVYAQQGYFEGSIHATNGNFSGKLTIGTGDAHGINGAEDAEYIIWSGKATANGNDSYQFYVNNEGKLYAQNANIAGIINVEQGILHEIFLNEEGTSGLSDDEVVIWINADNSNGYTLLTDENAPSDWTTYTTIDNINYYNRYYENNDGVYSQVPSNTTYTSDTYYEYIPSNIDRTSGTYYLTNNGKLYTDDIFLRGMIGIIPLDKPIYRENKTYYRPRFIQITPTSENWENSKYWIFNSENGEYELITTLDGEMPEGWTSWTVYEKSLTQFDTLVAGEDYIINTEIDDDIWIDKDGEKALILTDQYYKQGINNDKWVFWEGNFDNSLYPTEFIENFWVNEKGDVFARNLILGDTLSADSVELNALLKVGNITINSNTPNGGTISNGTMWSIDGNGFAQFKSASISGKLSVVSFEKDSTSSVGGTLFISPSQVLNSDLNSTPVNDGYKFILSKNTNDDNYFGPEWDNITQISITYVIDSEQSSGEETIPEVELHHNENERWFIINNTNILPAGTVFISTDSTTSSIMLAAIDDTNNGPHITMHGPHQELLIIGSLNNKLTGTSFEEITNPGAGIYANNVYLEGHFYLPQAGMTNDEESDNPVRIWAGSSPEGRTEAPFQVLQDGTLYASKGVFKGSIEASDSTFSGWLKTTGILVDDDPNTLEVEDSLYVAYSKNRSQPNFPQIEDLILKIDGKGIAIWEGGFKVYTDSTDETMPSYIYNEHYTNPIPYIEAVEDLNGSNYRLLTSRLQVAAATYQNGINQFYSGIGFFNNSISFNYIDSTSEIDNMTADALLNYKIFNLNFIPDVQNGHSFEMGFSNTKYIKIKEVLDEGFDWSAGSERLDMGITGSLDVKGTIEAKTGLKVGTGLDKSEGYTGGTYLNIKEYTQIDDTWIFEPFEDQTDLTNTTWTATKFVPVNDNELIYYINFTYQSTQYNRIEINSKGAYGYTINNPDDRVILWNKLSDSTWQIGRDLISGDPEYAKIYFDYSNRYNINFTDLSGENYKGIILQVESSHYTMFYIKSDNTTKTVYTATKTGDNYSVNWYRDTRTQTITITDGEDIDSIDLFNFLNLNMTDEYSYWQTFQGKVITFTGGQSILDSTLYNYIIQSTGFNFSIRSWIPNKFYIKDQQDNYILMNETEFNNSTLKTQIAPEGYYVRWNNGTVRNIEYSGFDFFVE